jgi:uncharacterized protein (TIGR00661 family)
MRILYGVVGEGMGHATRSKTSLEWLLSQGHQVKVVVSNRAYGFLDKTFSASYPRTEDAKEGQAAIDVIEITGLVMRYVEGAFDEVGSLVKNVLRVPGMIAENVGAYYDDVVRWKPQAVISDFDSFAYLFGKAHRLPILSIDNQQIIQRCEIPDAAKDEDRGAYTATKAFVKAKLPGCDRYVITSFFYPKVRDKYADKTVLVPPILRKAILDAKPTPAVEGTHYLVYQTSTSDTSLIPTLNALGDQRFVVYGLNRDETVGNCTLKPFSETGFVHDLATARGVLSNGGYSLLGEAVSLHRPVFSVPVRNQYEQILNAFYVRELGYGMFEERIVEGPLRAFVARTPEFAAKVSEFRHDHNQRLFAALKDALDLFETEAFAHEVRKRS